MFSQVTAADTPIQEVTSRADHQAVQGAVSMPAWRTSLVVQGLDPERDVSVPVVVGLVDTVAGGVQVALQVGDDRPVILPLQEANQLAVNVNETTAERLKVTGERLGDGEP